MFQATEIVNPNTYPEPIQNLLEYVDLYGTPIRIGGIVFGNNLILVRCACFKAGFFVAQKVTWNLK